ncbi:hypothetical protein CYMTET_56396 [Cymbomonas tetramitiformis]|uniref:Enoyl reductase (ER) domain-containing protein n=1 Tax=Cymbomonas tetramitiformis TaxID=36881 RepID=A0AAE0BBD0_9CHLO|nr:hypothetical protein CYMTET_56396 [Cymbomonas tetramitiformis]
MISRNASAACRGWQRCNEIRAAITSSTATFRTNGEATRSASSYAANNNSQDTMSAAVLQPDGTMEVETLRLPQPQAGEVLLKTKACGVCHTDLHVIKSEVPFPKPAVMGHEVSGEVVSVGEGSSDQLKQALPVGRKAVGAFIMPCTSCYFCDRGQEEMCEKFFEYNRGKGQLYDGTTRLYRQDGTPVAMYSMGGMAEYCVIPSSAVSPLQENVPYEEAAILGCALFTAYGALKNSGKFSFGETLAVIGTGGIGSSCIQIAKGLGAASIIAVDVCDEKLSKMTSLGATHTVNSKTVDPVMAIKEITGGRGVDVAVEAIGLPSTFETATLAVRDGGRAVMVGIAPVGMTANVNITHVVRRQVAIQGSYGARASTDLPALMKLVSDGHLDVVSPITKRFNLSEAGAAYQMLNEGKIIGRGLVEF